jgi:hypothetical protein
MKNKHLSRRQFLALTGGIGGTAVLAACTAPPAAAPAAQQPAAEKPAAVEATEAPAAPPPAAAAKEVHCWLGWHQPTEWEARSAEHPTVVNSTRILQKKFEADNQNIKIVWDEGPGQGVDFVPWLTALVAAGTAPDLMWCMHNIAVQNGWALAMDEYLALPNPFAPQYGSWMEEFYPAYMTSLKQPDGKVYAAPLNVIYPNIEVGLAYNQEILDKYGLKPPATWRDEMDVAKELKKNGNGLSPWPAEATDGNLWPFALQLLVSMMQPILPQMDKNADKFIGIEECLPAFQSGLVGPKTPIYLRAWDEMYELAQQWIDGFATIDLNQAWNEGRIGLTYCGSWDFARMANDPNVKFERGFIPPPIPGASDVLPKDGLPGAVDPPKMTAGDGTVPGELVKAVQGTETVIIRGSVESRGNVDETIRWWQFLTEPKNNGFMVNENQERIPSCVDAPLGKVWQGIAQFKLPLYDYGVAWWGEGLYWDNENFMNWRKIFTAWVTGQIDRETFLDRQQTEWEDSSARYEKLLREEMSKKEG